MANKQFFNLGLMMSDFLSSSIWLGIMKH